MAKKTVMIVDDEESITKMVHEILTPEGYKVISALSGAAALAKLKKTKPDLILIDFLMPNMTGLDLCKAIRADSKLKDIKVVFLTAIKMSKKGMNKVSELKVLDYIAKPFDYQLLIESVKKLVH